MNNIPQKTRQLDSNTKERTSTTEFTRTTPGTTLSNMDKKVTDHRPKEQERKEKPQQLMYLVFHPTITPTTGKNKKIWEGKIWANAKFAPSLPFKSIFP